MFIGCQLLEFKAFKKGLGTRPEDCGIPEAYMEHTPVKLECRTSKIIGPGWTVLIGAREWVRCKARGRVGPETRMDDGQLLAECFLI
jgi:hypothetical protein